MKVFLSIHRNLLACLAGCGFFVAAADAQMAHVTAPAVGANHQFNERMGVGFGFGIHGGGLPGGNGGRSSVVGLNRFGLFTPHLQFQQGGGGFGGARGGGFGFGAHGRAGGFGLNFFGSQGASSSIVSQSPSVTVLNGATGYFFHGQTRSFVAGVTPVVGGFQGYSPPPQSVLQERLWRLRNETISSRASGKRSSARAGAAAAAHQPLAPAAPSSRLPMNDDPPLILKKHR